MHALPSFAGRTRRRVRGSRLAKRLFDETRPRPAVASVSGGSHQTAVFEKEPGHFCRYLRPLPEGSKAFELFVVTYEAKYPKATECLAKDQDLLLAFYDYPAEHRLHIRTTNPIESVFSTMRLRHDKTKGSRSRSACLAMVYKLMEAASKSWRSLNGSPLLAEVIKGTIFIDGIREKPAA